MRVYNRLLATAADAGASKLFRPVPMALLPPIPLYRRLLRAHRKLPREERTLGDLYVKAEFHAHRDIDNPVHIIGQLYELMNAIRKQELEDNDLEHGSGNDK
ncbi:hypothetical protein SLS60_006233 [Paraconiothyrium brasiliense]|uniref:Succinate dehydrogenase assembly factor 3 n=1 Tax=Paraconiothyrium brasiliense TaxID=300254 RepID=A0ABR3REL9_9PLEO